MFGILFFCLGPYLASLTLDSTLYVNKSDSERNLALAASRSQNPSSPATGNVTATSGTSAPTQNK